MIEVATHIHAFLSSWKLRTRETSKKTKPKNQEVYDIKDKLKKDIFPVILNDNGFKSYSIISKLQNSGTWANPPYFAFLRDILSTNSKGNISCTEGIYPILFLPEDSQTILLAIGFADYYTRNNQTIAQQLRETIRERYNFQKLIEIGWNYDISSLGSAYDKWKQDYVIFKEYNKNDLNDAIIKTDFINLMQAFDQNIIGDEITCSTRWTETINQVYENNNTISSVIPAQKEIIENINSNSISNTSAQTKKQTFSFIQRIFFGAPGTGKSTAVKKLTKEDKSEDESKDQKSRVYRTTFHPDYDYATFVGSYKPKAIKDNKGKPSITYTFQPQVFANAYVHAWKAWCSHETEPIWLVIEEINRGNCAQIFGDLFQLLDRYTKDKNNVTKGFSEYPIKANADFATWLQSPESEYSQLKNDSLPAKGELKLPPNLNIVATMNTSDQSLFPMDSAFKRRWSWEYVPIDLSEDENKNPAAKYHITIGDKSYSWLQFLKTVNAQIRTLTASEDKQLGTYFINGDVDVDEFTSKVIFYLWSDICKDEYRGNKANFMRSEGHKPVDGSETNEFTYNELFETETSKTKILQGFMDYLKVPVLERTTATDTSAE